MIHYNSNNNAYCRAVNAETFQTIQHNPVLISILLYTRNPYSYSHFEIIVCIYSVRGDIDKMSTNTPSYTICSSPIVYIFVYILIETRIAPLRYILVLVPEVSGGGGGGGAGQQKSSGPVAYLLCISCIVLQTKLRCEHLVFVISELILEQIHFHFMNFPCTWCYDTQRLSSWAATWYTWRREIYYLYFA